MTKSRTAAMIAVSLALATGFTVGQTIYAPHAAFAADAKKQVSPKVGKPLQDAIAAVKAGKLTDALAKAQEADKIPGKTPYETFLVNQVLANIYLQQKNYAEVAKALEAEQATGEMSPQESNQALKQIAGMQYSLKNYPKVIEIGSKYLKEVSPTDTDMLVMVAQAQYLQNKFKEAADGIHAAMKAAQASNQPVKEDWLQLLMSAENQQGNIPGTITALQQLIAIDPKEEYWKNLIAYTERSSEVKANSSTKTTLDLYLIKFQVGTLSTAQEYTDMAELSLQNGLPGEAKKVIDKGIAVGILGQGAQKDRESRLSNLANTQAATDQKTLDANEAEARKAKSGDALVNVGEAYWSYGMYDKAAEAIQAGIAKGVTSGDDAKLRLVMVYVSAGKRGPAADAMKGIAGDSAAGKFAQLWLLSAIAPMKK